MTTDKILIQLEVFIRAYRSCYAKKISSYIYIYIYIYNQIALYSVNHKANLHMDHEYLI